MKQALDGTSEFWVTVSNAATQCASRDACIRMNTYLRADEACTVREFFGERKALPFTHCPRAANNRHAPLICIVHWIFVERILLLSKPTGYRIRKTRVSNV